MKRYVPKHTRHEGLGEEEKEQVPTQPPTAQPVEQAWPGDVSSPEPQSTEELGGAGLPPTVEDDGLGDEEYHEPIPAPPAERPKRRLSTGRRVATTIIAAGSIAAVITAGVFLVRNLPGAPKPQPIQVVIPRGLNAQQIGEVLQSKDVIDSPTGFKLYAELQGVSNKLQPGSYTLRQNMQYKELVALLARGPEKVRGTEVTIPEGYTIRQVAERVGAATGLDPMELALLAGTKAQTFRYDFLQSNPTGSLEGYLFPKTYLIPEAADQRWVIDRMLSQFQKETASLDWTAARRRGLSVHEVVTIASLIEREARLPSERALISAVIANRLRIGKRLEVDATVQYGLPEWKDRLTLEDLKVDSPYNTYIRSGLPPGPIANPGLSSIKAALAPAKVKYLYYVLADSRGKHTFTNTYDEFLRAKANSKAR